MRHTISHYLGLGNSTPAILNNNKELKPKEFWDEFLADTINNFKTIADYNGFDFSGDDNTFVFGIEPTYKYDRLEIIGFDFEDKNKCFIVKGIAWGVWGSDIVKKVKYYSEYKYNSKYKKFIDKWYDKLKNNIKGE